MGKIRKANQNKARWQSSAESAGERESVRLLEQSSYDFQCLEIAPASRKLADEGSTDPISILGGFQAAGRPSPKHPALVLLRTGSLGQGESVALVGVWREDKD